MDYGSAGLALAGILVTAVAAWLVSLRLDNVGIVDSLWSIFMLEAALCYAVLADDLSATGVVVLLLVVVWALRLAAHIAARSAGQPEDRRYRAMRLRHEPYFRYKSLYLVFLLQGVLAFGISLPLLYAVTRTGPPVVLDGFALALWLTGFVFEAVGDWQLRRFTGRDDSDGRVLDTGLWRYTRHPNYFGEACMWWSYWLFASVAGAGWTIFAPLAMTVLLLKVSGVVLLEKNIAERRPAYRDYVRRTNAFFPWLPRRAVSRNHGAAT